MNPRVISALQRISIGNLLDYLVAFDLCACGAFDDAVLAQSSSTDGESESDSGGVLSESNTSMITQVGEVSG